MFYRVFVHVQYEWPLLHIHVTNSRRYKGIHANRKFGERIKLIIYVMHARVYTYTKSTARNRLSNSRTQVSPRENFIEGVTYDLTFTSSCPEMHEVDPPFQRDVPLAHFLRGIVQHYSRHPIITFAFTQKVSVEISG